MQERTLYFLLQRACEVMQRDDMHMMLKCKGYRNAKLQGVEVAQHIEALLAKRLKSRN